MRKIDQDFSSEREEKQRKRNQIKARMGGQPNWWHGTTASPVTGEITPKITQVVPEHLTECVADKREKTEHKCQSFEIKEYANNCKVARTLKEQQNSDCQMCFKKEGRVGG